MVIHLFILSSGDQYNYVFYIFQGPKLTFLSSRQVATEIFFSIAIWKNVVAKTQKKSVNKIFPSQRNANQNFWLPDGKFWSPIFLLRIRTKRTRLGPQWRFTHLPLKNHDKRIECRLYTQFHKTAKCFKST